MSRFLVFQIYPGFYDDIVSHSVESREIFDRMNKMNRTHSHSHGYVFASR